MSSNLNINDDELEALMAELEAQNAEILAVQSAASVSKAAVAVKNDAPVEATPEEPSVETAAGVEAGSQQADSSSDLEEAELAALQAELEACQVEDAVGEVSSAPAEDALPADAVAILEKNGTAIDEQEPVASHKGVSTEKPSPSEGFAAERRVTVNEDGSFNKPTFIGAGPNRPTEAVGPNNLQHYIDVDQFRADTRVSEANLDQCMIEQSGLRAWYGAVAARAEAQAARVKAKFEVVEATLYDHHRKELAKSGEKTTEKMVENAVKLDSRWLKAKNMVIEAETIASINKGLVESIKDRRDMIIQLGADRRDEYKGAARVLAEQGQRDELRDRAMRAMQGRAA